MREAVENVVKTRAIRLKLYTHTSFLLPSDEVVECLQMGNVCACQPGLVQRSVDDAVVVLSKGIPLIHGRG